MKCVHRLIDAVVGTLEGHRINAASVAAINVAFGDHTLNDQLDLRTNDAFQNLNHIDGGTNGLMLAAEAPVSPPLHDNEGVSANNLTVQRLPNHIVG